MNLLDCKLFFFFGLQDGSYIIISNLEGKAIERINVYRDVGGTITNVEFDKTATIGLGKNMVKTDDATFFKGTNAFGNPLIGSIVGAYTTTGLANLTPNGFCKENGCVGGVNGPSGGRPNTAPICPLVSAASNRIYTTMSGGGLFVIDISTTPMQIIGEYGNQVVYGAGCGGSVVNGTMYINSGVFASTGAVQSVSSRCIFPIDSVTLCFCASYSHNIFFLLFLFASDVCCLGIR
jgi:hypothetical protein